MRTTTYVRKYGEMRAPGTPAAEKVALKTELTRTVRTAVNKWLENNHKLGCETDVKNFLTAWHALGYDFTLNPNTPVKVTLYAADQTATQGYTTTPIATYRISKKELFN